LQPLGVTKIPIKGNYFKPEEGTSVNPRREQMKPLGKTIENPKGEKAEKRRFEEKKRTTFAVRSYSLFSYSPK
jgi:hypothetical protein